VTCDQGCAPPPHTVRRHRSIIETHICRERYCVKLLGVGRGDVVAAWPSQDRTPLNEPFERLVSDHRRSDTLYVLPSDSVLLYKDPPCEPKSDLTKQNQQFRNKQTNTRPIFSPLLGRSPCLLEVRLCPVLCLSRRVSESSTSTADNRVQCRVAGRESAPHTTRTFHCDSHCLSTTVPCLPCLHLCSPILAQLRLYLRAVLLCRLFAAPSTTTTTATSHV
jgi:hypothetical protein